MPPRTRKTPAQVVEDIQAAEAENGLPPDMVMVPATMILELVALLNGLESYFAQHAMPQVNQARNRLMLLAGEANRQ